MIPDDELSSKRSPNSSSYTLSYFLITYCFIHTNDLHHAHQHCYLYTLWTSKIIFFQQIGYLESVYFRYLVWYTVYSPELTRVSLFWYICYANGGMHFEKYKIGKKISKLGKYNKFLLKSCLENSYKHFTLSALRVLWIS